MGRKALGKNLLQGQMFRRLCHHPPPQHYLSSPEDGLMGPRGIQEADSRMETYTMEERGR